MKVAVLQILCVSVMALDLYAAGDQMITLLIKDQCMVRADMIRLEDVACAKVENTFWKEIRDLSLAKTPLPGLSHNISKFDLIRALRQNNIDTKQVYFEGASSTHVFGAFQDVSVERIEKEALLFYLQTLDLDDDVYRTEIEWRHRLSGLTAAEGELEFRFQVRSDRPFFGTVVLSMDMYVNGEFMKTFSLMGNKRTFANVYLATEEIAKESVFSASQFVSASKEVRKEISMQSPKDLNLNGFQAVKRISEGTAFEPSLFSLPVVISRNQIVQAVLKSGVLEIMLPVKSKMDGKTGDMISVVNVNTGALLSARVLDSQNVEVII